MMITKEKKNLDYSLVKIPEEIRNIIDDKEIIVPSNLFTDPLLKFPPTPQEGRI